MSDTDEDEELLPVTSSASILNWGLDYFVGVLVLVTIESIIIVAFHSASGYALPVFFGGVFTLCGTICIIMAYLRTKFNFLAGGTGRRKRLFYYLLTALLLGCVAGIVAGVHFKPYWELAKKGEMTDVSPLSNPNLVKAGMMSFTKSSYVDLDRAAAVQIKHHTKEYDTINPKAVTTISFRCAAPVVSSPKQTNISYWAVAENCCSIDDDASLGSSSAHRFWCSGWQQKGGVGLAVAPSPGYKKAINESSTEFHLTSVNGAIYTQWSHGVSSQQASRLRIGIISLLLPLAFPLLVVVEVFVVGHCATVCCDEHTQLTPYRNI
eukprot:JP446577.1.p1 GENE.JP446577.1~~JP446577.1.p1  ORF type:complete len:322 (-),score=67.56 JP446577.1:13-978(-)